MDDKNLTHNLSKLISWYHPAFIISTWFGIGKIAIAPGTMGSLAAFPVFILFHYLLAFTTSEQEYVNLFLLLTALLYVIGQWATGVYMKKTAKHDPKEIVIDEVVGQLLVFLAGFILIANKLNLFDHLYLTSDNTLTSKISTFFTTHPIHTSYISSAIPIYLICFVLFRFFDILKPWPISWCDKNIKGSFGVMFDDLFAAMYAIVVLYGTTILILM
jgi:phosphatidylglycerophosphatase A